MNSSMAAKRPGLRHRLVRPLGRLQAEELHAADLQERQHGQAHGDEADAADALQQAAPEQDPGRSLCPARP